MTFVALETTAGSSMERKAILRKTGLLFISTTLKNKLGLQKIKGVSLYVDNKLPKIALEPVELYEGERGKTRKIMIEQNGICINLAKALKHFKLDKRSKNYEFDLDKDKTSGFLILDLLEVKNDLIVSD